MDKLNHSKLIDALGGTGAVAKICGDIKPPSVSNWRKRGIPAGWLAYLESAYPKAFRAAGRKP